MFLGKYSKLLRYRTEIPILEWTPFYPVFHVPIRAIADIFPFELQRPSAAGDDGLNKEKNDTSKCNFLCHE
jgi:hypothetical protein